MFLKSASTISHQLTFRNPGFSNCLAPVSKEDTVPADPDYSEFISAAFRRRMSPVLKSSVACSLDALKQAKLEQPDAIIVGTGMGSAMHTHKFMDKIHEAGDGLISPTSFILSTHNTIAGQISLILKNHGYNMTHTQNTLSFEQALIDAELCLNESAKTKHVLAGGADETDDALYFLRERLQNPTLDVKSGSSFFVVSKEPSPLEIKEVGSYGLCKNATEQLDAFLQSNQITISDIDLILFSAGTETVHSNWNRYFAAKSVSERSTDFMQFSGAYLSNSAFGVHFAADKLFHSTDKHILSALVINNLFPENLGLVLMERTEH